MSAFGIGINTQGTNAGEIRGKQIEIACACWFTSNGKTIPYTIKYQDENGEIQTINEIIVKYLEEKNYSGIPSVEYDCTLFHGEISKQVKLIFFKEECRWVMIL